MNIDYAIDNNKCILLKDLDDVVGCAIMQDGHILHIRIIKKSIRAVTTLLYYICTNVSGNITFKPYINSRLDKLEGVFGIKRVHGNLVITADTKKRVEKAYRSLYGW